MWILLTANILGNNTKKNGTGTLTKEQLRDIREKTEKGQKSEAIVIKQDELERMKATTKITTKEYEIQQRRLLEEQKESAMAAAKARKQRMLDLDKERALKMPPTEQQLIDKEKADGLLTKAQQMLDEDHDDVKHMN